MKSSTSIVLSGKWWERERPKALEEGAGKIFHKAVEAFLKANGALQKDVDARKLKDFEEAIAKLETAAREVIKQAKELLKNTRDSKEKQDLQNTIAVMGAPLARELDNARGAIETAEPEAPSSNFGTLEEHGKYLSGFGARLKKGTYNFAVVMPSADASELRMAFHRSRDGRSLANLLKKSGCTGKFTWGVAAAEALQGQLAEEDDTVVDEGAPRTLVLALDAAPISGLAKKVQQLLRLAKVASFNKVKLLVGDKVIEDDESSDPVEEDEQAVGEQAGALHSLWSSLQKLKAEVLPLVGPAADRYPESADELRRLATAARQAEENGQFDLAIATLRDQLLPALRSASRLAGTTGDSQGDLSFQPLEPSAVADKRDVVSKSLAKVLDKTLGPKDSGLLGCFGGGSPTTGKKFFDAVKVTFPGKVPPQNAELLRDWSINMAMLQHLASTVPADSPQYKALMNRTVGYLLKFANIPNTGDLGWQSNPAQLDKIGTYHRSGGSRITEAVNRKTAETLGVPPENCVLVSDRRVLEEVRRNFASEGELTPVQDWGDDDYDRVLRKALAGEPVFIDASGGIKQAVEGRRTAQNAAEEIIVKLQQRAFANAVAGRGHPGMTLEQLDALGTPADRSTMNEQQVAQDKKRVAQELALQESIRNDHQAALSSLKGVRVGGVMALGDQNALVMFPFSPTATVGSPTPLALSMQDAERMRGLVGHSGLTAGPEQLLDHWVSQTPNVAEILRELGVTELPKVEFPKGKTLSTFQDVRENFNTDRTVQAFSNLAKPDRSGTEPPPYVKVTVEAMMSLIDGLQYGKHGFSVRGCLKNAGLESMWALSLNKIQALMAKATANKASMRGFLDQVALIQEEIANLIAVAQPYNKEDFDKGMREKTDIFPDDFLGDEIGAEFTLKNSASRCFNAVLTACEDMKEKQQGSGHTAKEIHLAKRGLEVLVQADSYYEPSMYVLSHAREHRPTELDTSGLLEGGTEDDFDRQLRELKQAQDADNGRAKLDTYLCEFHHNIAYGRQKYNPEDVTRQVRKLITAGVVANPFTVAIDTTIAKTDEQAVKDFLAEFKQEIKDGAMNVAIYRSAQKFDQLGADTYNGGVMCVISARKDGQPNPFQQAISDKGELPSEQNLQGLTHLNLHAQEQVNAYRTAIMENTRKIGDPDSGSPAAIPRTMLLKPENSNASLLQIAVNEDDEAPFLDIKFPFVQLKDEPPLKNPNLPTKEWVEWKGTMDRYEALYNDVQKLFSAQTAEDPEATVTSTRASFGFQHSNVTLIGPVKLRLNPGLEDPARLKGLRDTLVDVNDMLMTLKADLERQGGIDPVQLEHLAKDGKLITLPVLEAHRNLRKLLADDRASDKKKDEARLAMIQAWTTKPQCANPPGVLRLIDEMSNEFKRKRLTEITRAQKCAKNTLEAIRSETPEERLLAEAKAEKRVGNWLMARTKLALITKPFADDTLEKRSYDELSRWILERQDDWDDDAQQAVEAAERARDANDPVGVHSALQHPFTEAFKTLRQDVITSLKDWADLNYVKRNERIAEELFTLAAARIEEGDALDAKPYLDELQRMQDKGMPGLPDDLTTRLADFRTQVKMADARRYIAETLVKARELEAVGNKSEILKLIGWIDKVLVSAAGAALDAQTTELERLREYAQG